MDLHNNSVGRKLAEQHPAATPVQLTKILISKIDNGELLMLDKSGKAVPTKVSPQELKGAQESIDKAYENGERGQL